jgi:hypothetical protein
MLAIGAAAALLGGSALLGQSETQVDMSNNFLQNNLIEEYQLQDDFFEEDLTSMEGFEKHFTYVTESIQTLKDNVMFTDKVTSGLIKPEELAKFFSDSGRFAAEINSYFPSDYSKLIKYRQDLKMHQFDLSNTLTDAKLMADSIKNDIRGTSRKLALRQKKLDKDDLSAKVD